VTKLTAVVLAGRRGGADPVASHAGVAHKALAPVAGVPMVARVLAALRATPEVARIVVVIEAPETALSTLPAEALQGVELFPAALSPSLSVAAVLENFGTPLLVTTADHALLTPEMVSHFCAASPPEADVTAAVARDGVILAAYPDTRRTWLRFSDGAFSGCNLFLLRSAPAAGGAIAFWRRVEQHRKRPLAMARLLGPFALLRFALGLMPLSAALETLGRRVKARLAVVEMPFAEAAVDVDKPEDLALAEAILAKRG
jgi:GTP:adenosylcobinamide-phosphate guanylyltransferase